MSVNQLLISFFSWLPLRFLYALEPTISFILYKLLKYRRGIIIGNISRSFPEKSPDEIEFIAKQFYKHLSIITLEALKSRKIPRKEICARFHLQNPELVEEICKQYGGALLLTSHFGNWEWGVCLGDQLKTHCIGFYKTLHNPKDNALMLADRNRFKTQLEPVNQAARILLKNKQSGNAYILLCDQHPVGSKQTAWMTFLNQPTEVNMTPALLGAKFGYPIIYLHETSPKKGYYEVIAHIIEEHPQKEDALAITKKYMHILEKQIQDYPSQWLWSHRRWKSKPPEDFESTHD
jgi:KDO2-lipid IV(A) lauroyltransferase